MDTKALHLPPQACHHRPNLAATTGQTWHMTPIRLPTSPFKGCPDRPTRAPFAVPERTGVHHPGTQRAAFDNYIDNFTSIF